MFAEGEVGFDGVLFRENDCLKAAGLFSESLRLPASLFLRCGAGGRLVQLDGALLLSGVERWRRCVSNTDCVLGVIGGPRDGGLLCESLLDDRELSSLSVRS
jgi:hypothetical protein